MNLPLLSIASILLAAAIGASYAYVDLLLNRMGMSAAAIGLNASMPALGWLLATPLMPWALRRFNSKALFLALLAVAIGTILCFPVLPDANIWMLLRFLFGGGTGMVFRLVEYWINAASPKTQRARFVGLYAASFAVGIMIGVAIVPIVGVEGWPPILMIAVFTLTAGMVLATLRGGPPPIGHTARVESRRFYRGTVLLALSSILVFGLFEAALYTLMPVYAMRSGLADHWAVWCTSAAIGGQIVMAAPIGILADRLGKTRVLVWSALAGLAIPAIIPFTMHSPEVLLCTMLVWGGFAGSLYNIPLAMLADYFQDAELATANAAFGILYALGNLCGPILHGLALDAWNPQGLMVSTAILFGLFLCAAFWHSWRAKGTAWTTATIP